MSTFAIRRFHPPIVISVGHPLLRQLFADVGFVFHRRPVGALSQILSRFVPRTRLTLISGSGAKFRGSSCEILVGKRGAPVHLCELGSSAVNVRLGCFP